MSQHNKPNYRNPPDLVDEQPPSYDEVLSEESRRYAESSRMLLEQQEQQEQQSPYYLNSHSQRNQPAYYPYQGPHYQAIPHPHVLQSAQVDELYYFPTNAALFLLGFIFPPLWCVGSCCTSSRNRYERWWQKWNTAMSILFIMILLSFVFVLALLLWDAR